MVYDSSGYLDTPAHQIPLDIAESTVDVSGLNDWLPTTRLVSYDWFDTFYFY
jgi:hypothetical protein